MTVWQKVALTWAVLIVLFVLFRIAQAWVREFAKRRACEDHQCDYYLDYLQKGSPNLSHSQYHEALNSLEYWKACEDRYKFDEDRYHGEPWYTTKMVEVYRRQVRI